MIRHQLLGVQFGDELAPCIRDIQVTAFLEVPRMFFDANFRH